MSSATQKYRKLRYNQKMSKTVGKIDFQEAYLQFSSPTTPQDCGKLCAPHNPSGKPFCCDICHAVPVAYRQEWHHLEKHTRLWHIWRGDECVEEPTEPAELLQLTPGHLLLLACKGPEFCERNFRTISCRQFPFFPYITADFRFIGLACDWEFESKCWILSHLDLVTDDYRQEFIQFFDRVFSIWMDDFDSYSTLSEEVRDHFSQIQQRFPILHRNGKDYLIDPTMEKLERTELAELGSHPPY